MKIPKNLMEAMAGLAQQTERPVYDVPAWNPNESAAWEPLQRQGWSEAEREFHQQSYGITAMWLNTYYMVTVRDRGIHEGYGNVVSLTILQHNGDIRRDWREWQQIKNQIVGSEWTAIEVYPPESQLVDNGNTFHLWCFRTPLPFGLNHGAGRQIAFHTTPASRPNRPYAEGEEPPDAVHTDPAQRLGYVGN